MSGFAVLLALGGGSGGGGVGGTWVIGGETRTASHECLMSEASCRCRQFLESGLRSGGVPARRRARFRQSGAWPCSGAVGLQGKTGSGWGGRFRGIDRVAAIYNTGQAFLV